MHRKEINKLRRVAAEKYNMGKEHRKEAYELWTKADKERKALQAKKSDK